jgi:hypothetical protein
MSKLTTASELATIIESVAAVGAVIVGAWWFVEQRENYPRADVSQVTNLVPIKTDLFAVETNISIKNEGKRQLKLHRAQVMLQAVSAAPYDYMALSGFAGAAYWRATRPKMSNANQFHDGELRWPVIRSFDGPIDHHIEPGETDNLVLTFLMRCSDLNFGESKPVHLLRLATDVFKPEGEEGKDFAWKARSFIDVSKECRK